MLIVVSGFTHSRYPVGYVPLYLKTLPFSEPDCVANAVALSDTFGNIIPFIATLPVSDFKFIAPLLAGLLEVNLFHFSVIYLIVYGALTYNDDSVPAKIATLVESLSVCLVL
jgi:hypothetical protein